MNKKNIDLFRVFMSKDIDEPILKTLHSGFTGEGPKCAEFEDALRDYFNYGFITTVNSGTSGLQLAIHILKKPLTKGERPISNWPGIEPGEEVLVCPLTCYATIAAIINNGLKPKWVDVDIDTCNMDLDDLARKISPTTKIILPVLWGGASLDLFKLKKIQQHAREIFGFQPAIVEDAAHGFGAEYDNKKVGTHGHISVFSLQSIKTFSTGDGGIINWPHEEIYQRARLLRWFGLDRDDKNRADMRCAQDINDSGFKYQMNDITATIGLSNLKHIDKLISINRDNASYYNNRLSKVDGIEILNYNYNNLINPTYWLYTIKVDKLDDFTAIMKSKGITNSQVHLRCDNHSVVKDYKTILPNLDSIEHKYTCIPVNWWINDEDRTYIVDCIEEGW